MTRLEMIIKSTIGIFFFHAFKEKNIEYEKKYWIWTWLDMQTMKIY